MRVLSVFVVAFLAVASLLPAASHGRSVTVRVHVWTSGYEQPVSGAEIEIVDPNGNPLGSSVTDANGQAEIKVEVPEDVSHLVIGADQHSGSENGYTEMDLHPDRPENETKTIWFFSGVHPGGGKALPVLIKRAIAKCDKAEYDHWVAELDRLIASLEEEVARKQASAENFARNENLRVTDLKGARKDLERAAKAQAKIEDASLRNPATLSALNEYVERLQALEWPRKNLEAARKARQEVPPFPKDCKKTDEVGLVPVPGNCPDGAGGGLLAGAINDVFGTDLAAACPDRSQRRDADRPNKDRDRHHDRRD